MGFFFFYVFANNNAGGLEKVQCMLLKTLLVLLSSMAFMVDCGTYDTTLEAPSPLAATVVIGGDDLPLHPNVKGWKHFPSRAAPIPSRAHSHLSVPFPKRRSELESPASSDFKSIAPMHSISDAIPSAMGHPPLSPYASSKPPHSFVMKFFNSSNPNF